MKNKTLIFILLSIFLAFISTFVLNQVWKISLKVDFLDNNNYVLVYERNGKIKEKKINIIDKCIIKKITINTDSINLKNSDTQEYIKQSEIKNIYINNFRINNFEEYQNIRDKIKKTLQIKFFSFSYIGIILIALISFLLNKFYLKLILKLHNEIFYNTKLNKYIFISSFVLSFLLLLLTLNNAPTDHLFRQTQTAITADFLIDSLNINSILNYETPVLGYPWAIPFEFPIYQVLCALAYKITHIPLDMIGKIISWIFLALCLIPIHFFTQKISNDKNLFYIISSLFLFSPLYIIWGKSFMIETTILFFGLMFLQFFIKYLDTKKVKDLFLLTIFAILCGLGKITTLPPFILVAFLYFCNKLYKKEINLKHFIYLLLCAIFSLFICILWIKHTDVLKELNPLGIFITSKNLTTWNYGTIEQRLSPEFYNTIFVRMNNDILGNFIIFILSCILIFFTSKNTKRLYLLFLIAYFAPIMLFSNLHFVHNYYQTANAIFLIFGVGCLFYYFFKNNKKMFIIIFFITICTMSINNFYKYIKNDIKTKDTLVYQVGDFVQKNTPQNSSIIVLGCGWSSEINYYSKRKGVSYPLNVPEEYDQKLINAPNEYCGNLPISALVTHNHMGNRDKKIATCFIEKYKPKQVKRIKHYNIYYDFELLK